MAGFRLFATRAPATRSAPRRARLGVELLEDRLVLAGTDPAPNVSFRITNDWGSGYQAEFTVVNTQPVTLDDWRLAFDLPHQVNSIWNATVVSHVGTRYTVAGADWNADLAPGASATFGVTALRNGLTGQPTNYVLTWGNPPTPPAVSANVAFTVTSDWGSGFGGQIAITNTGTTKLSPWKLEFDFGRTITSIWNAKIQSKSGTHYVIVPESWNRTLAPGATVSFGFNGTPGNVTTPPANYVLNGVPVGQSTPPPALSIADVSVTEGDASAVTADFVVSLSRAATQPVTVQFATRDGTARAGVDYTAATGTLTFQPGQTSQTVRVSVPGDTVDEPDRQFFVSLSNAAGATVADNEAVGTIVDNDPPPPPLPTLSITDQTVMEGNSGTTTAAFTVALSAASTTPVTVAYATADGTATAGSDYTVASGTLTFAPGETQKIVNVAVIGDTADENDETFRLDLSNPSGATLLDARGDGTIRDDDNPPPATTFNYGEALQKSLFFYGAQRAGDLPNNYFIDWRGDAAMQDGADVGLDLTGGFWDAGDHVKFGLPMAASLSLLTWGLIQYQTAYAQSGQLARMLETIKWGTDYLIKAHPQPNVLYGQVGNGSLDHSFWGPAEVMQMARPAYKIDAQHPGSDLAGETAAALAAASIAFRATDSGYADLLLRHARELYTFADTYRGKYSDSIPDAANYYNSYSGYDDELVWGAVWLYKATGEAAYLSKAESLYAQRFAGQTMTWTHSWDDKRYGSAVLLAQLTGKAQYQSDAERWLDYWSVGINGGATRITYTPGGLAFLNGWGSLRYAATTSFLALVYSDTVRDYNNRYHDFALGQINYILGANPNQRSYMVGFGNNYPLNPHHRGASGIWDGNVDNPTPNRHILYGALVGGPESANDNNYHDVRSNYISNEVALDYNAGFQGALARLYLEYGGTPLANFPVPEVRDHEFFVAASINQQGSTFTEIRGLLNNRSAWPARLSSNLSFRYFLNLTEVYNAGFSVTDVQVVSNYSQGAQLSGLVPWDATRHLYYVDVSFQGVVIGPGAGQFQKEAQVRIGLRNGLPASAWDPTNDWSYQGLLAGRDNITITPYIPVYEFGNQLLAGQVPSVAPPGLPTLRVDDVSVTEGDSGSTSATFTVRLSAASTTPVTVGYATGNGTATAGSDYTAASGTVTFAPGETQKSVAVAVLGDTVAEATETFTLTLSNPTGATLNRPQATGTITDNDTSSGSAVFQFTVRDDWGSGFTADLTITNTGTTAWSGWTLAFDFDRNIGSIWNAVQVSHTGNHYVVSNAAWNGSVAPGASVTFGFQGSPGNVTNGPTNYVLTPTTSTPPPSGSSSGSASNVTLAGVDPTATQVTVAQSTTDYALSVTGRATTSFRVLTNNDDVVSAQIVNGTTLRLQGLAAGRASLRIEDTQSGAVRYLGVRVRTATGQIPGLPNYLAIGSVSEDTTGDLAFWRDFDTDWTNKRMDVRYIYLNGGPVNGWRTWTSVDGDRLTGYLRESQKLGMVPYFVWYNIPDGGESYYTDRQHMESASYMEAYYRDLKFALDLIRANAPDDPVGMILEPDFIGYMMQNSGQQPHEIMAQTNAAYRTGGLDPTVDPIFPDTLEGLVKSVNYMVAKFAPNVQFGWQFNLWASPGITVGIPATGLMHLTDTMGITAGRAAIAREAQLIADYYVRAGVLSYGADFLSIDKYGLDAGAQSGAATNPAGSTWFWNLDHWNNYLLFTKTLHQATGLPVVLWQIPIGHINHSLTTNPYDASGVFPDLTNTHTKYEDSAPTFFFGDRFTATGSRFSYFTTNQGGDTKLSVSGSTITWGNHLQEAKDAGIVMILFGAGVGESTDGVGSGPTDAYWWITKVQEYFQNPLALG